MVSAEQNILSRTGHSRIKKKKKNKRKKEHSLFFIIKHKFNLMYKYMSLMTLEKNLPEVTN